MGEKITYAIGKESCRIAIKITRIAKQRLLAQRSHMPITISESEIKEHLARVQVGEVSVSALCREIGISKATFYKWRKAHGEVSLKDYPKLKVALPVEADKRLNQVKKGRASIPKSVESKVRDVIASKPVRSYTVDEATITSAQYQSSPEHFSLRSLVMGLLTLYALLLVVAYLFGYSVQNLLPSIQYEQRVFLNESDKQPYEIRRIKELWVGEEKVSYSIEVIQGAKPAESQKSFEVHKPEDCTFLHAKTWACRKWGSSITMTDGVLRFYNRATEKQLVFFGLRLTLP